MAKISVSIFQKLTIFLVLFVYIFVLSAYKALKKDHGQLINSLVIGRVN